MNTTSAIRAAINDAGISMSAVSAAMGKSANYTSSVITQAERMGADMNTGTVAAMAKATGCALALVPLADLPDTALVIDPPQQ